MSLHIPAGYVNLLGNLENTEKAIKAVKDMFQDNLSAQLALLRVTAPMTVMSGMGLNDDLSGAEKPVSFIVRDMSASAEIVHSLAKWKRMALKEYGFESGEGLYTDMNAIRRDETTDNIHSIYVDQWDWEKVLRREERTYEMLEKTVRCIYSVLRHTEIYITEEYDFIGRLLPEEIYFITTQELEDMYPDLTPKEREYRITKDKGAVFLMQIGDKLKSGKPHDGRAPDYDDWTLNGDILVYYPVLDIAFELSSMGIRVDEEALVRQLNAAGCPERSELTFHRQLLDGKLPYTMGGGIGQSRMCMFFLRKAHIGEVQSSYWEPEMIRECNKKGVCLL